jgi:hypothetical protein
LDVGSVRRAARLAAGATAGLAAAVALVASADVPSPTPTNTGLMGALSSELGNAKKQAANAPRDALSSAWTADSGPSGSSSSSGSSASSSSGGPDPADTALQHELPSEADLEATLAERRASAQEHLARHLEARIGDKPVDASLIDELRRHARVIARLDRIGFIASERHDDGAMKRVTALLSDEFQLHASEVDRWLAR